MPVTMRDVARKAGVSVRTVSRVVNNRGEVTDETRQRVQTVIQELGYRPNVLARGLISGKTLSVGLIIPEFSDPFFPDLVHGVESVAYQHGYTIFLCNTNADPQRELDYVAHLADKQVDGVILCGSRLDAEQISQLSAQHNVTALTTRHPRSAAVISIPGEEGLCEITSHLIQLGHRAIGYVGMLGERADGYHRGLRENGIESCERWVSPLTSASVETGRQGATQLLNQAAEITGIVCYNDLIAVGALQACAGTGRRVPQEMTVVGFDDIPLASLVTPKLTTMRVPRYKLGEMLMEQLLRVIAAEGDYKERLVVPIELVVRESSAAPKGDANSAYPPPRMS